MSASSKTWTGIIGFLPFLLFIVYMGWFFGSFADIMVTAINQERAPVEVEFVKNMMSMILLAIIMGMAALAAMIIYIIHVVNNKSIESGEKIVWIVLFIFAGLIAYPVYWFMRIKDGPAQQPGEPRFSQQPS